MAKIKAEIQLEIFIGSRVHAISISLVEQLASCSHYWI